ncbi:hypothetical protein WOLCODRAFT_159299 [Wolfiporia cocos MD-104 SS10]|uniref:Nucleotidylyl transferase n=1 Tax=Wolfiporia cocos (strain MD-104) TaxID=742152 RepID=A0A2H3JP91_WOLCO|nr:hypothetical protein WOLCODRAFT_159299 [Wolfiporia cocos MD-104 SS10]
MAALSTFIERVHADLSPVELVYTSHEHWPRAQPSLPSPRHLSSRICIMVLDSFNPPARAHLALANVLCLPAVHSDLADTADYGVKLPLLSMHSCSRGTHCAGVNTRADTVYDNVAVGIIHVPTLVGKSSALLAHLRHHSSAVPDTSAPQLATGHDASLSMQPQLLAFLVGMDTLERLFAPHFYESEEVMIASLRQFFSSDGDNACIVCACRSLRPLHQKNEAGRKLMQDTEEYLQLGIVSVIDIAETERLISSTMVH